MTFSDEPGIYIRDEFGVRLEDDMHITEVWALYSSRHRVRRFERSIRKRLIFVYTDTDPPLTAEIKGVSKKNKIQARAGIR